jgi:hypothetical protein
MTVHQVAMDRGSVQASAFFESSASMSGRITVVCFIAFAKQIGQLLTGIDSCLRQKSDSKQPIRIGFQF